MNPALIKLIQTGGDITKEVLKYANDMQNQINYLNKEELDDHNRKIMMLQQEHDIIVDMAMNKDLTYDQKMELINKMENLQIKIDEAIAAKTNFEHQEKEKVAAEKKKAGQVALEIVTGVIPITTAYRAIKKKKENKKAIIDAEIEIEDQKSIPHENKESK